MKKVFICSILLFCVSLSAFVVYNDIDYYAPETAPNPEKNQLDVYVPDGGAMDLPVLFFVHGGSWAYGDRSDYALLGEAIADQEGYVTVIISYRLSDSLHPEVTHPDHIVDVAKAFAWTVNNISSYGGDPEKIFALGHSAGAHLVTLLSTNTSYLETAGVTVDDIIGTIAFNIGIYDIPKLYADCGMWASMGYEMMGFAQVFGPIADSSTNWYDASPKYHIGPNMPPSIFFVGTEDMEHIIGGNFYGFITLPGEIQFLYDDMNAIQPTDTFWLTGDHNGGISEFVYNPTSLARTITMSFIENILAGIEEPIYPDRFSIATYPNPFNSTVSIDFRGVGTPFGRYAKLNAKIFDLSGRLIEELRAAEGAQRASAPTPLTWTPADNVISGIYFVKLTYGDIEFYKRIIYLK